MPEVNIDEKVVPDNMDGVSTSSNTNDFSLPKENIPFNQMANQGVPKKELSHANPLKKTTKPNQTTVFGKSELLNANQILSEILNLQIGHRVADLGAGGGMFTLQAARLVGDKGEVYAVDVIKNSLMDIESKARMANLYNIKTVWSNIEIVGATKITDETIDIVMLVNVLFQANATDQMILEGTRLLKRGGKMLIIDWSNTKTGVGPHRDRQIDPQNILSQAQMAGLKLQQEFAAGQYHFGLIFIKP